jgi:hypothetical protein
MATQAQMDRLLGKALFDEEFRRLLLEDPEAAARKLRYRLDGNQVNRIKSLDPKEMHALAEHFCEGTGWGRHHGFTIW